MRLSLRFILPLAVVLALIAYAIVPLVDGLTLRWFVRDLDIRAALVANTMQEPLQEYLRTGSRSKTVAYFTKITQDERLYAIGFCEPSNGALIATKTFPKSITCRDLERFADSRQRLLASDHGPLHVSVQAIADDTAAVGRLVLVHDMSFIQRRSEETKRYVFYFFIALGAIVSLITVVVAQLSWRGLVQGMRALLRGEGLLRPVEGIVMPELRPIEKDLRELMREVR